jgi:plasmid stability protein
MVADMDTTKVTLNLPTALVKAAKIRAAGRHSTFTDEVERALRTRLLIDDLDKLADHQTPDDVVHDAADALEISDQRRRGSAAA